MKEDNVLFSSFVRSVRFFFMDIKAIFAASCDMNDNNDAGGGGGLNVAFW